MKNSVAALICVKNSAQTLGKCLESLSKNGISEIIVIDGESTDDSWKIAETYTNQIYSDLGNGLGYARKLGVSKVSSEFLLIMGPDDLLAEASLSESLDVLHNNEKVAGLLAHKRLEFRSNFWERGQDGLYKLSSSFPVRVIGNPSLYRVELLRDYEYDEFFSANEDTDLCERWWDHGYSVSRAPKSFQVFETTPQNRQLTYSRYTWYGRGDYDFVSKWIKINRKKAIRHLFHPLKNYMILQPINLLKRGQIQTAVFSICAGILRYIGFFQRINLKRRLH
jgi:glycosyltransferase involved in cell wall biosynthesis